MCVYYMYTRQSKTNMQSVTDKTAPRDPWVTKAPRDPADAARTKGTRSHCRPAETDRAAAARQ